LRKKREQEDPTEKRIRTGPSIRNRRTVQDHSAVDDPTESPTKKRRTVEFVDRDETIEAKEPAEHEAGEGKQINHRRRGISFRME